MVQNLSDVYENVVDRGAIVTATSPREAAANTRAIRAAIATGKHVLFPAGRYLFSGTLEFCRSDQRCTFLAGAILVPIDSKAYVRIGYASTVPILPDTGKPDPATTGFGQTFIGFRIEAPAHIAARSPLVEIYGADSLLMQELRVAVTTMAEPLNVDGSAALGPRAAVRAMVLTRCKFIGGSISGGQESGTIGLWLANSYDYNKGSGDINPNPGQWWPGVEKKEDVDDTAAFVVARIGSSAGEVGAIGLAIERFGWAVRIGCICDNQSFIDCSFTDNVDGALIVRDDADILEGATWDPGAAVVPVELAVVSVLTLVGCHMGGASPLQYVLVEPGSEIRGGVILGCTFGPDGTVSSGITLPPLVPHPNAHPNLGDGLPRVRWLDPAKPLPASAAGGGAIAAGTGPRRTAVGGAPTSPGARSVPAAGARTPTPNLTTARVLDTVAVRRSSALSQKPSSNSLALSKPGGARSPVPSRQAVLKGVHSGTRGVAGALAQPPVQDLLARCIFRVRGSIVGVVVSGCCSQEAEGREDVWNIPDVPATLTELNRTCDMFNSWAEANLATGARANLLVRLWAARDGELTVTADSVAFGATKAIGFFGTGPFEPSWKKYSFNGTEAVGDRNLRRAGPELVLAQLLLDLSDLGLIRRGS